MGREKDYTQKALRVNGYPDRMLADFRMSDQCDPGLEEQEVREWEDGGKEEEQKVPATTKSPVAATKKKYPVVLPYVRGISEQLWRVFKRSLDIP